MSTNVELGKQQLEAVSLIRDWYSSGKRSSDIFYLGGYAGTGKTTVASRLAKDWADEGIVAGVMAPTGKAAEVLTRKGLPATTIHKVIYRPLSKDKRRIMEIRKELEDPNLSDSNKSALESEFHKLMKKHDKPEFEAKEAAVDPNQIDVFIIDEFSMVPDRVLEDVRNLRIPILALGDPGQLPPVRAKQSQVPDYVMDEIHRQALDNPIIQLSMMARKDGFIPYGDWGKARRIGHKDYVREMLFNHDQVVCGIHKTRYKINQRMRDVKGFGESQLPVKGDKLICLKNDYRNGFVNGMMCVCSEGMKNDNSPLSIVTDDGREFDDLTVYVGPFHTTYGKKMPASETLSYEERIRFSEFDFGYAITCHKAQGSEWDSVLVIDEPVGRTNDERSRWLYTAVTRARDTLTIVNMDK